MKSFLLSVITFSCIAPLFAGGIKKQPPIVQPQVNLRLGMMKDKSKYLNKDRNGKALSFGYFQFDSEKLNNYLDTSASVHGTFANNYMGIAIDNISNNSRHGDAVTSLAFILPQTVYAGAGDSLTLRMKGWHWTTSIFAYDFIAGEMVTLALGPSFAWGNLKMQRTDNGQKTKYTNPFVAPGARAEFRLTFGNFMIGGRATYRYDITHGLWKRKDAYMPVMPEYKNNGLAYFGYIGLIF